MIKEQETLEKYGYLPGTKRTNTKPVIVECDYCHKIFEKEYKRYIKGRKDLSKDCCASCTQLKINELNSIRGHHLPATIVNQIEPFVNRQFAANRLIIASTLQFER